MLCDSSSHPLVAFFPLHQETQLEKFEDGWLSSYGPYDLVTCPCHDLRDYFGERIGFILLSFNIIHVSYTSSCCWNVCPYSSVGLRSN
eukprot:UN12555